MCLGCNGPDKSAAGAVRCFNEAEARVPRMQWGFVYRTCMVWVASMRPRRVCLGCRLLVIDPWNEMDHASMRPRRVCLGCAARLVRLRTPPLRFNEAEARVPRMPTEKQAFELREWLLQ